MRYGCLGTMWIASITSKSGDSITYRGRIVFDNSRGTGVETSTISGSPSAYGRSRWRTDDWQPLAASAVITSRSSAPQAERFVEPVMATPAERALNAV